MNILWIILAAAGGYVGGYLTCFFWGSSRKTIKVEVADAAGKAAKKAGKLGEGIKRQ